MLNALLGPRFSLIYRGVDIGVALAPDTLSVSYTDYLHGQADQIEVTVHDASGKWQGAWFPEIGDTMQLTLYDGKGGVLPAGTFELDEPNATGGRSGDLMTLRGVAAPVTGALRSEVTRAYENQSTENIVRAVAGELGMDVLGEFNPLSHKRVTQRRERHLEFLKRLAEETGHYCNLRGSTIIFTNFASIDGRPPSAVIFRGDRELMNYDFRYNSKGTYSSGQISYLDDNKASKILHQEQDPLVTTGDVLKISGERTESRAHSEARLKSELHFANRKRFTGSTDSVGNTALMAGNTVALEGFGAYSATRVIDSSTHVLDRGGYATTLELVDARV